MFEISKAADLIQFLKGGQPYWAFPFSKGSLQTVLTMTETETNTLNNGNYNRENCITLPPPIIVAEIAEIVDWIVKWPFFRAQIISPILKNWSSIFSSSVLSLL